jgi:succinyl-CoA synthetase alpha subunit
MGKAVLSISGNVYKQQEMEIDQLINPTIFTLIGGACVPSVITFGTPRLGINNVTNVNYDIDLYVFV